MSDEAPDQPTPDAAEPTVEPTDINYEGTNLARSGVEATEDGQAPGDVVEDTTAEPEKTEEEKAASEAAKTLAGRKTSLVEDLRTTREDNRTLRQQMEEQQRAIESWRPVLEKLEGRPDLVEQVLNGRMTVAQAETTKDRDDQLELREVAEDMGFYKQKPDGTPDYHTPDLERADKYRSRHQRWAKSAAEPLVQPLAQTAQQRAIYERIDMAVAYASKTGDADPEIVREELTKAAAKNPQWILDNDAGNLLYDRAVARTVREGKRTRPAATERRETERDTRVVHTEAAGGKAGSGPRLTASEKALGEQYGLTDKDWARAEAHGNVRRGWSSLVDD